MKENIDFDIVLFDERLRDSNQSPGLDDVFVETFLNMNFIHSNPKKGKKAIITNSVYDISSYMCFIIKTSS